MNYYLLNRATNVAYEVDPLRALFWALFGGPLSRAEMGPEVTIVRRQNSAGAPPVALASRQKPPGGAGGESAQKPSPSPVAPPASSPAAPPSPPPSLPPTRVQPAARANSSLRIKLPSPIYTVSSGSNRLSRLRTLRSQTLNRRQMFTSRGRSNVNGWAKYMLKHTNDHLTHQEKMLFEKNAQPANDLYDALSAFYAALIEEIDRQIAQEEASK